MRRDRYGKTAQRNPPKADVFNTVDDSSIIEFLSFERTAEVRDERDLPGWQMGLDDKFKEYFWADERLWKFHCNGKGGMQAG